MSEDDRIAAAEEHIMRLQHDQEQLDRVVQTQANAIDLLMQRLDRLEQRLARLEPDDQ